MSNNVCKVVNTEKTHNMVGNGVYVFLFLKDKRRDYIKAFLEKKYSVKIDKINVLNNPVKRKSFRGTVGRLSMYKKIYIKVAKGMKIDNINGISSETNE